jgi:hypothetical protein
MNDVGQKLNCIREEDISVEWTEEEKNNLAPRYGCEILAENATYSQQRDKSFPSDAYLIWYNVNGNVCVDVCRGSRSNIFDLYYDKFGPDSVKKIDFGYGMINPKVWGYQKPQKKRRK